MQRLARPSRVAVLTSGGDAPGMNAATRAVVRTASARGIQPFVVHEGFRGLVEGGDAVVAVGPADVGGILQRGGTWIGTARSDEFLARDGRRRAVASLLAHRIDALVVVGGDGSLTGADVLRREWAGLVGELVDAGELTADVAADHPRLRVVGIAGSIDNDLFGTDMTVGADTALHRITEAIDAIHSTASSHQRSFVIEVMGRNCGYLALMAGLATGANWVFLPEHPPPAADWEQELQRTVRAGRRIGRRQNLVIVAEGARDRHGESITASRVRRVLAEGLGEDTRITILGHVQRGGAPSGFDRNLGTRCGYEAIRELEAGRADDEPRLVGLRENRIVSSPLTEAIERTHAVVDLLDRGDHDGAMALRGSSFAESWRIMRTLVRAQPRAVSSPPRRRLLVLHAGAPAPGMNTAVRAAVRVAMDGGTEVVAARGGFPGLLADRVESLDWMSVSGWVSHGGAELGTARFGPDEAQVHQVIAALHRHRVDGLLMIGGFDGYLVTRRLQARMARAGVRPVPIVCLPATISNDVPGTELSVGADTALNNIVSDVDKIKQSAVAARRVFVVEVMGKDGGYLALTSGLATGAEKVYTPEEGITLDGLRADVADLRRRFDDGARVGLIIRGEHADRVYTTAFLWALFEKEGAGAFDVRPAILGHLQQGGDPSPFDRIQATRLAARCVEFLHDQAGADAPRSAMSGLVAGRVAFTDLAELEALVDPHHRRPVDQRWLTVLRPIADAMAGTE